MPRQLVELPARYQADKPFPVLFPAAGRYQDPTRIESCHRKYLNPDLCAKGEVTEAGGPMGPDARRPLLRVLPPPLELGVSAQKAHI